jgi:hypothetical protein
MTNVGRVIGPCALCRPGAWKFIGQANAFPAEESLRLGIFFALPLGGAALLFIGVRSPLVGKGAAGRKGVEQWGLVSLC